MHNFSTTASSLAHDQVAETCLAIRSAHKSCPSGQELRMKFQLLVFLRLPEYTVTLGHLFKSVLWFRVPHF